MPNLTQIELPTGSVYDLVDQGARDLIAAINNWSYVVCTNAANTPKDVTWQSGSTTITGTLEAASSTMYKIYLVPDTNGTNDTYDEYITVNPSGTTYKWEMFGNTKLPDMSQYLKNKSGHSGGTAGDLAYKDSVSASYTPAGTVSQPTFTGSSSTVTITSSASSSGNYQPTGTVSQPTFSGSSLTSTGTYTPAGSVSLTNTNKSTTVSKAASGDATYTPEGTVSTPTISLGANGTTSVNSATKKTVVTDMAVADPSATAATGELVYCSVSGTKLTLKKFVETTGDSITTSSVSVVKGAATWTSTQPTFTGTGARLVTGNIAVPSSASFSGTEASLSVSGTPSGTVSQPSFTGTKVQLSGTTTASGTVSQPTFSGTAATITST